jgi:HEAT repeat protein
VRPISVKNEWWAKLICLILIFSSAQLSAKAQANAQYGKQRLGQVPPNKARQEAWEILTAGAQNHSREKRAKAFRALGLLSGESRAVDLAEDALEDKEPEVRVAAAQALGEMGSIKSVPKLERAMNDKKISVSLAAAHSLVLLKNNSGYELYYAVLTGRRKGGGMIKQQWDELKNPKVAAEFAFEQGIGFAPYAGSVFEAFRMLTKKDPSPIRAAAAGALAHDPDPDALTALTEAVSDKNWLVRVAALRAISMRGDRTCLDAVQSATQDEKDEVRYAAAAAVVKLTADGSP